MSDESDVKIPDKLFFRIGELSELVGVEPHVLRYWEQEFRIRPQRSPSGQRMYRRRDIARFLQIRSLLYKQGFTISGARKALLDARQGAGTEKVADLDQLRKARDRIEDVRDLVAVLREEVVTTWDAHLPRGAPRE
ncbi:MAG: MerR family transcriptional regulator [Alphaproteobacteria bacterium]|nr:MerR family transcriptional regulator [Alphaproteobacteria bacterium]